MSAEEGFRKYRRHLPHLRTPGVAYFITWCILPGSPDLSCSEKDCIVQTLQFFNLQRYELFAYVVMNDHIHVLVWIFDEFKLESIVHSWKSFTTNQLRRKHGRSNFIWQKEYYDRIIRGEQDIREKMQYIYGNPIRRWPEIDGYAWHWMKGCT